LLPRVLQSLPCGEPYVLLGESFGGPLSLRIAASHPPDLRALVLSASFISRPHHFVPRWAAALVRPFPFRGFPHYARVKALLGGYSTSEMAVLSERALSQVAAEVFARRVQEVVRVDATRELAQCTLPILYLQGSLDRIVPAANLHRILAVKPDMEYLRVPAPHMLLQTEPAIAAAAIEEFIRRKAGASATKEES